MFVKIPKYDNYFINESGIVMDDSGEVLRVTADNNGYLYVYINDNIEYIHNLVCETFLAPTTKFKYPKHIDGDILNNHVSNISLTDHAEDNVKLENRSHRQYSGSKKPYEVFNEDTGDSIICYGRGAVAELIQYEEISLKNMVGNGRKIFLGPYKGYQIRRIKQI